MSGRGTMTSSTGVSEKSKTLSIICCSSGSSTPARSPWRSSMRSSISLCDASSSFVVGMPSIRMTSCASQSRNPMNQAKTKKKTPISGATARATFSARGNVYDFGTISPITTCRIEMTTNAMPTDSAVAVPVRDAAERALQHTRHGGLTQRAQCDRRERDPELHRGDEMRGVGNDLAHGARTAIALAGELVEPRVAHRYERVLGRDEERVPEDEEGDEGELDGGHDAHRRSFRTRSGTRSEPPSVRTTRVICLPGCGAASSATPGHCSNVIDRSGSRMTGA